MKINVIFDKAEKGVGYYIDFVDGKNIENVGFDTDKESALLEAKRISSVHENIPIRVCA